MNEHLDPTLDNLPPEDKEFDKALRPNVLTILQDRIYFRKFKNFCRSCKSKR